MEKNNIIFVGGIHGVGKTTLCKKMSKYLKIRNYSSSDLIYKFNSKRIKGEKKVENINLNQDILIEAVNEYLSDYQQKYLLDGQFCLINKFGHIQDISIEVFKNLRLRGIIVVIDSPENIIRKLKSRDNYVIDKVGYYCKHPTLYFFKFYTYNFILMSLGFRIN